MPSERKFYKTTITFTVLSEEPLPEHLELGWLDYEVTEGHCSGLFGETIRETVDAPTMAKLLQEQASDPEFFLLDANGNDVEP
jgi:hypothetical protein